jgi:hypothetical protein
MINQAKAILCIPVIHPINGTAMNYKNYISLPLALANGTGSNKDGFSQTFPIFLHLLSHISNLTSTFIP